MIDSDSESSSDSNLFDSSSEDDDKANKNYDKNATKLKINNMSSNTKNK